MTAVAFSLAATAWAVPAKRVWRTVTQPDGTTLTVRAVGDENLHFLVTDDDKIVTRDKATGFYCYGHLNPADGALESSGVKAFDRAVRPASHVYLTTGLDQIDAAGLIEKRGGERRVNRAVRESLGAESRGGESLPQTGMGRFSTSYPNKGKVKGLIILAEYSDMSFRPESDYRGKTAAEYFRDMATQRGFSDFNGTGSATDFFEQNSMGQFNPEFVVVGPVKLPHECAYYGGNTANGDDRRPAQMIADACRLADSEVDFSEFDNDGDGYCDNVFVFYAGQGEASYGDEDTIWPHAWNLSYGGVKLTLDGVRIDSYACTNEWEISKPDGVGTFVHEFSHVMGLPDLYSTAGSLSCTPGAYSALDYGPYNNDGRTPPAYSAFERNAMGWIEPQLLVPGEPVSVELGHILSSNQACLVQTERKNEFFLLENRQQTGWDAFIPGHGLLIWHVEFDRPAFTGNIVNNSKYHQCVDIIEANNMTSYAGDVMAGYPWPGTTGKTEFTFDTEPSFQSWNGNDPGTPLTDIAEADGAVTFNVCGGYRLDVPRLYPVEGPSLGDDFFVLTWEGVEEATDYKVDVAGIPEQEGVPETETVGFEPSETGTAGAPAGETFIALPAGWSGQSSVTGELLGSVNRFGVATPSMKFKDSKAYLETKEYDCAVSSVTFSFRGSLDRGSTLYLDGMIDGEWTPVWHHTQTTTAYDLLTETIDGDRMPPNVKRLRFRFERTAGTLILDDITVVTGNNTVTAMPDYTGRLTAGATSLRVDRLLPGHSSYRYRVMALNDETTSPWTEWHTVELPTAGVGDIAADGGDGTLTVSVNDRVITVTTAEPRAELFDASGRRLLCIPVSDGQARIAAPDRGFYIVRAGKSAVKVTTH